MRSVRRFFDEDSGATAIEYAVMLALIIVVCIASVSQLGGSNGTLWGNTNTKMSTHLGAGS